MSLNLFGPMGVAYDGMIPDSGNSSSWLEASEGSTDNQGSGRPKNGQVVLESLPELLSSLLGGTAALVNATQGTTPNPINNYQTTQESSNGGKEDRTAAYVMGLIGLLAIVFVIYFVFRAMNKRRENDRK